MKLSTAEDGQVDWKDQSLPSVSWEGIEYAKTGWSHEWDTEFDVPAVSLRRPQGRSPGHTTEADPRTSVDRPTKRFAVGRHLRHSYWAFAYPFRAHLHRGHPSRPQE